MEEEIKQRFEKVESKVDKIEGFIFNEGFSKNGTLIKCRCGHSWITRSKALLVSCPRCGNKVRVGIEKAEIKQIKTQKSKKKLKRYKDFDNKFTKGIYFDHYKVVKCCRCKKVLDFDSGYWGWNRIYCKKCYWKMNKQASDEVDRAFGEWEKKGYL